MPATTVFIESWFLPVEILKTICTFLTIVCCAICLCIILLNKTCHTLPMILTANTYASTLAFACSMLSTSIATIEHDLKQIYYQDLLCIIQCYAGYVTVFWLNYSFSIEAMYRYVIVMYPTRLFFLTVKFYTISICLSWICGVLCALVFPFLGDIVYNVDNQICQIPLRPSFSLIYSVSCIYLIPLSVTIFIYRRLVHYVKQMSKRVTPIYVISRVQREVRMVRHTVLLVMLFISLGTPYTIFIVLSFFHSAPKYHFRLAYISIDISLLLMVIVLFYFNEPLKTVVKKKLRRRTNAAMTIVL
ncbi:unnamed protein product [Adineta ricciae]|uniref:G-protein coupled receptors family 1 profile domain-containing protein n=1 Tax=Adineta ricciae TaxID=249248 RepID=A0A815NUS9_ADIRI|nr:unnamed protein product [Adineta ricciae]CAF1434572.1 unnamed protein product [Adineta ricciae]